MAGLAGMHLRELNYFPWLLALLGTASWGRIKPVAEVASPYFRLSPDPRISDYEQKMADSLGINICPSRRRVAANGKGKCSIESKSICDKPSFLYHTVFDCCPGFRRRDGLKGCPEDVYSSELSILGVLESLNLHTMLRLLRATELSDMFTKGLPYTVFAPTDSAFNEFIQFTDRTILHNPFMLRSILSNHIVSGRWVKRDIRVRRTLETVKSGPHDVLHFRFYNGNELMVEDALVVNPDQLASNGIVHVVDRLLRPFRRVVRDVLHNTPEIQFLSALINFTMLPIPSYVTVFAPTNEAFFNAVNRTAKTSFFNQRCLKEFLHAHIIPEVVHLSAMEHWVHPHLLSRLGNRLVIESAGQRRFVINGSKVKVKTRTCRDGVVYIIDRVLEVPMTAYSIGDVLRRLKGVSTMMKYLESTDAIDLLDRTDGNFTLFLPTDESLELVAHEKAWPLDNTSHMRSLVQYHILPQLLLRTDIPGESKYVALSGEEVRIKRSQNQIISAQSACLSNLHGSYTACNGVIHVIHSNFLRPATSNLFTLIHSNPRLHAFRTVIHLAGLDHLLHAKEASYTVLAPIDDAFWKHPISTLHELFYDREKLKATLTYHLIEGAHYSCALLGDSNLRSLNGKRLRVRAEKVQRSEKILYFNYGQVLQKDIIASNGVIHILDDLLLYISKQNISRK